MSTPTALSYLDLVKICGNARIHSGPSPIPSEFDSEELLPFYLSPAPDSPIIGLLRPQIVELLRAENTGVWAGVSSPTPGRISLAAALDTHAMRTAAMRELCERWRDTGRFADIIGPKKWRAEMYPVYQDPFGAHDHPATAKGGAEGLNFAFEMERAACALFGIVTYGVHLSIYQETRGVDGTGLRLWIPTRASTKSMWPGYLDNTVAGGIPSGMPIFEALVKECMEEASLGEELVRAHTRGVGCISYFFRTAKGWLQPEVEYTYDMVIPLGADPAAFEPKPLDGEVESFDFLDKAQVETAMRAGRFKPNCAVVLIDLFIRLGYITPDNEPDYLKIATALHTRFDYERWAIDA
ncbi:NUDIX hydrolase domain-like protein [Mycena rosella]|uniref:NUDIX hydrolase domain-like protein n=1 Tax=Mycena rosella TaxID=1033263 RepID=A0AAD7CDG0_MYCRO|nr:NUDIX hydrolase domain-like protein [Mycena rosella]